MSEEWRSRVSKLPFLESLTRKKEEEKGRERRLTRDRFCCCKFSAHGLRKRGARPSSNKNGSATFFTEKGLQVFGCEK